MGDFKKKLNFNYGKPFLKFQEQPENYKEEFKQRIEKFVETFIKVKYCYHLLIKVILKTLLISQELFIKLE